MSGINLISRYLFNEIPDDEKKIDSFGYKAYRLSLAKKWQFPVPDTVFLLVSWLKKSMRKKVPAEILSYFKNKLLAIRPSPVVGKFSKSEPFLMSG